MLSNINEYLERDIHELLGATDHSFVYSPDLISLKLGSSDKLLEMLTLLRDHKLYKFKILVDLFGVDYLSRAVPKAFQKTNSVSNGERPERSLSYVRTRDHDETEDGFLKGEGYKRFEINYNLLSVHNNHRINIKIDIEDNEPLPSIVGLFSTAGWLEREVWDMYGITFSGNNDLRRILTDYDFEGHPLRKDFPLTGYKEIKYDPKKKKVVYEDVVLAQEFRTFDFESPWRGDHKS